MDVTNRNYIIATDYMRADGETDVSQIIQNIIDENPNRSIFFPDAILMHGTSSVRHNMGINESLIYGDYYYMEALVRRLKPDWNRYW